MRLKTKLTTAFLSVALLILILGYITTNLVQKQLQDNIGLSVAGMATRTLNEIDRDIFLRTENVNLLVKNPLIISEIVKSNDEFGLMENRESFIDERDKIWIEGRDLLVEEVVENHLSDYLREQMQIYKDNNEFEVFGEIFITNKYGANIAASGKTTDYRQDDEEWWREAKSKGIHVSDINFDQSAGIYSLDIASGIFEKGEFIGVVKAVLNIEEIIATVNGNSLPSTGHDSLASTLVDRNNLILFSTKSYRLFDQHNVEVFDELRRGGGSFVFTGRTFFTAYAAKDLESQNGLGNGEVREISDDKQLVVFANSQGYKSYDGLGWKLIMELDSEEVLGPVKELRRVLLFISVIIMGIAVFLGLMISSSISQPIRKLSRSAVAIGRGNFDFKTEITKRKDEIGSLAVSIEEMGRNLKVYQRKLFEAERKQKKKLEQEVERKTHELQEYVKKLEDARSSMLKMVDELKEVDRTKSNFLNVVSHELKTPLTAIFAYLDVLDDANLKLNKDQQQSFDALRRNSQQLKMIIGNILEISRIEAGKFELSENTIDPKQKIKDVVENLQILAAKKGIKLISKVGDVPKTIVTDEPRFEEILNNLVSNAIKFTNKGHVKIGAKRKGEYILIDVEDTGVGIPKSKIGHLFQKFYQVDSSISRKYGGTGLGLSITKQLIELQKGRIWVKSKEKEGTVFTFTLPIKGKKAKTASPYPKIKEKGVKKRGVSEKEIDEVESSFGKL